MNSIVWQWKRRPPLADSQWLLPIKLNCLCRLNFKSKNNFKWQITFFRSILKWFLPLSGIKFFAWNQIKANLLWCSVTCRETSNIKNINKNPVDRIAQYFFSLVASSFNSISFFLFVWRLIFSSDCSRLYVPLVICMIPNQCMWSITVIFTSFTATVRRTNSHTHAKNAKRK